jgi:hypothetical protein
MELLMSVLFRPARSEELQHVQELVVSSINDLTERHGFGPMASVRPAAFQIFSLNDGNHKSPQTQLKADPTP